MIGILVWTWPAWVPASLRTMIERDWNVDAQFGLDPRARWLNSTRNNGAPELGARVVARLLFGRGEATGRYVHCWNNIGRVITEDGLEVAVCSDGWRSAAEIPVWEQAELFAGGVA